MPCGLECLVGISHLNLISRHQIPLVSFSTGTGGTVRDATFKTIFALYTLACAHPVMCTEQSMDNLSGDYAVQSCLEI